MNPEWVEAGARALDIGMRNGLIQTDSYVAAVVAAVEPLIRADERERIAVWPNTRAFIEDEVRAQILSSVTALKPDENGRISKGLVQAMISGDVT